MDKNRNEWSVADIVPLEHLEVAREKLSQRQATKAKLQGGEGGFLRGPIPLPWLTAATQLSKNAIRTALAIWLLVGIRKAKTVRLSTFAREVFHLSPAKLSTSLDELEAAGLIRTKRQRGRLSEVTVLDAPTIALSDPPEPPNPPDLKPVQTGPEELYR